LRIGAIHLAGLTTADAAAAGEQREDRLETRTDAAGGHARGQVRRRDLAAARAAGLVKLVLGDLGDDRRDLDDLVTPHIARGILRSEAATAPPAAHRQERDLAIDVLGCEGLARRAFVPGLASWRAPGGLAAPALLPGLVR
jgi:hypothetical protein